MPIGLGWKPWKLIPHGMSLAYKKSVEKYEEFLDIWKDADPGIPEVEDAKERLQKLRTTS